MELTDLHRTHAHAQLTQLAQSPPDLTKILTPNRLQDYQIHGPYFDFLYGASQVDEAILTTLTELATEQRVHAQFQDLLNEKPINVGEGRPVLHPKSRNPNATFYTHENAKIAQFCQQDNLKKYTDVVQIGVGGSSLGMQAMYEALHECQPPQRTAHFISNVDPDEVPAILKKLDLNTTLFIFASKTGTTLETVTNLGRIQKWAQKIGYAAELTNQLIYITTTGVQMPPALAHFHIEEGIGGRFSLTSAMGGVLLSLCFGHDVFLRILTGAHAMDTHAENTEPTANICLMAALIGVWNVSYLHRPVRAVIPYSRSLQHFGHHIQQLVCESNGKSVSRNYTQVPYGTGPVILTGVGTDVQHSFFQLLHQGTLVIPTQFIGFQNSIHTFDTTDTLNANLFAQMMALATGSPALNTFQHFPGNRPSTLLWGQIITPESLGALLAFFEHQTTFEGFLWNIPSFDQEGVALGKKLALKILDKKTLSNIPQDYFQVM